MATVAALIDVEFTETSFRLYVAGEAPLDERQAARKKAFAENKWQALYEAALTSHDDKGAKIPESRAFSFLHRVGDAFFAELVKRNDLEMLREKVRVRPSEITENELLGAVPFAFGADYVNVAWLGNAFARLTEVFAAEITHFGGTVSEYLAQKRQGLKIPERIFFHIVEHKDGDFPFAFLATYATTTDDGDVRHMPLNYALTEYRDDKQKLTSLLACLNKAAELSPFIAQIVESGEMFHPLRLTAAETYEMLKILPRLEEAGILCRVPNWWRKRGTAVRLTVKMGEKKTSLLGFNSLVKMQPKLVVDGMELTAADIKKLLSETEGLAYLKGKWIEVDHKRMTELLNKLDEYDGEISLGEALRMEVGLDDAKRQNDDGAEISFTNGKWLDELMEKLRSPQDLPPVAVPVSVNAELRHYQKDGFTWLHDMAQMGFGACIADDMGLGKTLQVLTFLDWLFEKKRDAKILLIVPASLLNNWAKEAARFTPKLTLHILHGRAKAVLEKEADELSAFVTVTTYAMAAKLEGLGKIAWDGVILDEAQAIKNPGTKQAKTIKKIPAKIRLAITGTPIENDLSNLWSLFDFLNHGLLGTAKEFDGFAKSLGDDAHGYSRLKKMIAPFILRRLKTDKRIIADLPDKIEQIDYITPGKKQVVLYRKEVADLERKLADTDGETGIKRQGLVLAAITKLKQICNHPDQFLGQTVFEPKDSGKFAMLEEICGVIRDKRERVLVFTQYREMTAPLANFLSQVFGQKGLVIHGGTPIKKRASIVEEFNGEDYVPFIVLSVKAAGTGLNLTAANHVIHFDRWWNPAVENQATDRAFRIGQKKNVTVHKFVTEGTIEERIDAVISGKKELAESVIGDGTKLLTKMSNDELIKLLRFGNVGGKE